MPVNILKSIVKSVLLKQISEKAYNLKIRHTPLNNKNKIKNKSLTAADIVVHKFTPTSFNSLFTRSQRFFVS